MSKFRIPRKTKKRLRKRINYVCIKPIPKDQEFIDWQKYLTELASSIYGVPEHMIIEDFSFPEQSNNHVIPTSLDTIKEMVAKNLSGETNMQIKPKSLNVTKRPS